MIKMIRYIVSVQVKHCSRCNNVEVRISAGLPTPSPPRSPAARSSPATACRRSAILPMSARSRSRPRAGSIPNCCAAASWSAKSDAAPSFPAKRGAASPRRPSRAARASIWNSIIRCCRHQSAMIAKSLEGLRAAGSARSRVAAGDQHAERKRREAFRPTYLARNGWPPQRRADRLHRQWPAMHRGGAGRDGAARRTLRRRGADLSLHQGHRRPARRDAGAACDGRTWRAAGRRAKGPPRSASVGAVSAARSSRIRSA